MVFLKWHLEGHPCLRSASASGAELSWKVYLCAVANRRPESVTVELPTPRQEIADDLGLTNGVREIALGVEHRPCPRARAAKEGRGDIAATPMASGTCAWSIDNLELREFGETFLGEFRADARLLGAAVRNMRRHIKVLVDPHGASLDTRRDLVSTLRIG
jgi:hypothetical protein